MYSFISRIAGKCQEGQEHSEAVRGGKMRCCGKTRRNQSRRVCPSLMTVPEAGSNSTWLLSWRSEVEVRSSTMTWMSEQQPCWD